MERLSEMLERQQREGERERERAGERERTLEIERARLEGEVEKVRLEMRDQQRATRQLEREEKGKRQIVRVSKTREEGRTEEEIGLMQMLCL